MTLRERYGPAALIAGGSDGIGAAVARRLAEQGFRLILCGRRPEVLEGFAAALRAELGAQVSGVVADLATDEGLRTIIAAARGQEVRLLVCNAALSPIGPFLDGEPAEHERLIALNVRAPVLLARYFAETMTAGGGIVVLSSMAGFQGTALSVNYAASKAYVRVLAEGLWYELRPRGIDVLCVCAGVVGTPTFDRSAARVMRSAPPMSADRVARAALRALGHRPVVVPGGLNALISFVTRRILPLRASIALYSRGTRRMYPDASARLDPRAADPQR